MDLSIVIPAFRATTTLEPTFSSIASANFDGLRYEVVLVDDASDDGTA